MRIGITAESGGSSIRTEAPSAKTRTTLPLLVWVGGILILVSLSTFFATHRWMSSRTFTALNIPISLAKGHVDSGPFKINLRSEYRVDIDTGWESYFDPNCPSYDRVNAYWFLYKDGHVVAKWLESTPYTYLGGFDSENGTYRLNLEVVSDTACLNPGRPRLLVYTDKGVYEDYATPILWVSAFGVALGASLVVLGFVAFSAEFYPRSMRIWNAESVGQYFQWAQKHPLRKQFSSPPAFALLAVPCLLVPIIGFMILLQPYPSKGLYVWLLKPGALDAANDPLSQPVVVQVLDAGPGATPAVYVNSKATTWTRLSSDLKDELKLCPKWVVYVEADPSVAWADAVNVTDVAKGLHARVVLLTSKPSLKSRGLNAPAE